MIAEKLDAPGRRVPLLVNRPEALAVGASLIAWSVLIGQGAAGHRNSEHAGHVVSIFVMVVATMGLFSIPLLRTVVTTQPWWMGSGRVVGAFSAFVLTWLAVGLSLHVVADLLAGPGSVGAAVVAAGLVAACGIVALRPRRRRRLESCLSVRPGRSISSSGSAAAQGVDAALACARLCLLPMSAMLLVPGSWPLMAGLTGIGLAERTLLSTRRAAVAPAYLALAVALLVSVS